MDLRNDCMCTQPSKTDQFTIKCSVVYFESNKSLFFLLLVYIYYITVCLVMENILAKGP